MKKIVMIVSLLCSLFLLPSGLQAQDAPPAYADAVAPAEVAKASPTAEAGWKVVFYNDTTTNIDIRVPTKVNKTKTLKSEKLVLKPMDKKTIDLSNNSFGDGIEFVINGKQKNFPLKGSGVVHCHLVNDRGDCKK